MKNMCECDHHCDLGIIEIDDHSAWVYSSSGEFILDFKIKFCPFCGEEKKYDV